MNARHHSRWSEVEVLKLEHFIYDLGLQIHAIAELLERSVPSIKKKMKIRGWDFRTVSAERLRRGHAAFTTVVKTREQMAAATTLAEELRQARAELRADTPKFKCGPNGESLNGHDGAFW
jgi:hypothetical protein